MTLVFVDDLDHPELAGDDRHHLQRVLRLRDGEAVLASDGVGGSRPCVFASGAIEPVGGIERRPVPTPRLTIAFGITKGERPELAVQKLTEVGVDRIVPVAAARSVARWEGERAIKHVERLRRVAREAAMQSHRVWLPEVTEVRTFPDVAAEVGVAVAAPGGAAPTLAHPTLLVGPEGGWSSDELALDLPEVALGPHVLRAETAAIVAGGLLVGLREGLVRASNP